MKKFKFFAVALMFTAFGFSSMSAQNACRLERQTSTNGVEMEVVVAHSNEDESSPQTLQAMSVTCSLDAGTREGKRSVQFELVACDEGGTCKAFPAIHSIDNKEGTRSVIKYNLHRFANADELYAYANQKMILTLERGDEVIDLSDKSSRIFDLVIDE